MIKSPWSNYYKHTIDKKPNQTLMIAEKMVNDSPDRVALDIGSGTGSDSLYLLDHGFEVVALDQEQNAMKILKSRVLKAHAKKLRLENVLIQNFIIENDRFDLINASYSLPFCPEHDFPMIWRNIYKGLKPGGLFSVQLFGVNDDWSGLKEMSFFTNEEIDDLMGGYIPEYYYEIDEDGRIADGSEKHWHLFDLVLRKKQINS